MYYYINYYDDGHCDYIMSPRKLKLQEITEQEYLAAIAALEEAVNE